MSDVDVFIDGAGPTGLALAVECSRLGLTHRLIDRKPEPAKWSQALVVQARTLEQFSRYGFADELLKGARLAKHVAFYDSGERLVHIPMDQIPGRYPFVAFISQAETERALAEHLKTLGSAPEREVEFVSCTTSAGGVDVVTRERDGSERHTQARFLVGCDGLHSRVRDAVGIRFEGHAVDISFLLADATVTGDAPDEELRIYLSPEGNESLLFIAPLGRDQVRLLIALRDAGGRDKLAPSSEGPDGDVPGSPTDAELQAGLDRLAPGSGMRIGEVSWRSYFHVSERKSQTYRAGWSFLAGDAAHVHSPAGGQGMNTGIQDAANLAWKLAAVKAGAPDALLDSYDEERGKVARGLIAGTSRILDAAVLKNPVAVALRDLALRSVPRFEPMRARIEGFISETSIGYRGSSAVRDAGGDGTLRAGDRAPDGDLRRGGALLEPLASGRHLAIAIGALAGLSESEYLAVRELRADDVDEATALAYGRGTLSVIRPDGYLGYRGPASDAAAFATYAASVGLPAAVAKV